MLNIILMNQLKYLKVCKDLITLMNNSMKFIIIILLILIISIYFVIIIRFEKRSGPPTMSS